MGKMFKLYRYDKLRLSEIQRRTGLNIVEAANLALLNLRAKLETGNDLSFNFDTFNPSRTYVDTVARLDEDVYAEVRAKAAKFGIKRSDIPKFLKNEIYSL